ncbi:hypothetical protein [[Pantoea] beijingensis]|uniref:hypothetical protein n=1 Tax=[Pantoea] beijingensis TaxID=1324864 RepID=UPI000FE3D0B3|nr:hypothetical protein [[Pantoea] beijingensis]
MIVNEHSTGCHVGGKKNAGCIKRPVNTGSMRHATLHCQGVGTLFAISRETGGQIFIWSFASEVLCLLAYAFEGNNQVNFL